MFLLYSPLNQGLKLPGRRIIANDMMVFTLQSIKSRIETDTFWLSIPARWVFTLQSIKSRIETY